MKFYLNWKTINLGAISLCLLALVGCSTKEAVQYRTVKPIPLLCPQIKQCHSPKFEIKTNADLAKSLDQSLTTIELCQVEIQGWEACVEGYNKRIAE
ncbi:Rz1-like lysis system protein LysC [Glaesserella parasuis]|nr:Rz1-like lysis system protein LysC [Glaesserella parasuis]MCT8746482.1 Rz1-like lysis system protein LysC [Glaesserella parasuis]MCT8747782.1 Rz1-like lysis system protein LysC [Glaesserella parasuis]MCT8761133.1 Rz1-like lysis system protein LysC [Glaesserella parasuis]MCT8767019.1 Rz1-like lysis system protein LysC [Glaesserella parasuis]